MNKFEYKNLTPFKWFVLENFPFIEADFDALTDWQLYCKLGKEINKIIDSQNVVGTEMENVTNAFIELKNYVDNYFENLDVQDEINNKLNEMATSGELQNIIDSFLKLNSLICFNNVEDMQNSENLIDGSMAFTKGFYNENDGGTAYYLIRNVKNTDNVNNYNLFAINNTTLVAELLEKDTINIKQLGAKENTDDTQIIQFALDNYTNVFIPEGVFLISVITLNSYNNLYGLSKKSILRTINNNQNEFLITNTLQANRISIHDLTIDGNKQNSNSISGGINLVRESGRFEHVSDSNFSIYNVIIQEIAGIGIKTNAYAREGHFHDIYILAPDKQGIYINGSTDNKWYNITIHSAGLQGIYCNGQMNKFNNIKIFYTGYVDRSAYAFEIRQERQQLTDIQIQECIGGGLFINTAQNLITGLLIDGVDRILNDINANYPALYLTSRDNRISYGNYINGIITNGNVDTSSKIGLKMDFLKTCNNYINLQITNFRNIIDMPQWMRKFEQAESNFTNTVIINNENYNDLSFLDFTFADTPAHSANPSNGIYSTFNNKHGAKVVFENFNIDNAFSTFYIAKGGFTANTKYIIATLKVKSSNSAIRNNLRCTVTYDNGKTKSFQTVQDNLFFSNSTEYEDIYALIDCSDLTNISYVQFEVLSYKSEQDKTVNQLTIELNDFKVKYI